MWCALIKLTNEADMAPQIRMSTPRAASVEATGPHEENKKPIGFEPGPAAKVADLLLYLDGLRLALIP